MGAIIISTLLWSFRIVHQTVQEALWNNAVRNLIETTQRASTTAGKGSEAGQGNPFTLAQEIDVFKSKGTETLCNKLQQFSYSGYPFSL